MMKLIKRVMEILNTILQTIIFIGLFLIAYIDFKTQYIYDKDLIGVLIIILIYQIYNNNFLNALISGIIAFIIGFLIFLVSYMIYQEEAFGLGDVYLLALLGCYWLWPQIIHFLCFTFLFSGLVAIIVLIITKNKNCRIALAPILVFSIPLYYLFGNPTVYKLFSIFLNQTSFLSVFI